MKFGSSVQGREGGSGLNGYKRRGQRDLGLKEKAGFVKRSENQGPWFAFQWAVPTADFIHFPPLYLSLFFPCCPSFSQFSHLQHHMCEFCTNILLDFSSLLYFSFWFF